MSSELRIGVSACLLGQPVRYDGGHKRDGFVTEQLSRYATLVPVCPEVEIGLGTPRESLQLVANRQGEIRLVTVTSGLDHSAAMQAYSTRRLEELESLNLSGYVLKSGSPSCGLEGVPMHFAGSAPASGRGLFAAALCDRWPELPVVEERLLGDAAFQKDFLERVFAYHRLRDR